MHNFQGLYISHPTTSIRCSWMGSNETWNRSNISKNAPWESLSQSGEVPYLGILSTIFCLGFELASGASNIEMVTMLHVPQKMDPQRWRPPSLMLATCNGLRLRESMSGERWPHFLGKNEDSWNSAAWMKYLEGFSGIAMVWMSLIFEVSSTYTSRLNFISTVAHLKESVKAIVTFWAGWGCPNLVNLLNIRGEFGNCKNSNSSVLLLLLKSMKCAHLEFLDSRHETSDATNWLLPIQGKM